MRYKCRFTDIDQILGSYYLEYVFLFLCSISLQSLVGCDLLHDSLPCGAFDYLWPSIKYNIKTKNKDKFTDLLIKI